MRIVVLGSGGREHALAWKLSHEADVRCAPGNAGIAEDVPCSPLNLADHAAVAEYCLDADLVVVGPEDPLIAGLADSLRGQGLAVFGPGAEGARLEGSKAFSKAMMARAGVPTARFSTFTDPQAALDFAKRLCSEGPGVAVKASGAALGKGVVVCTTFEEAREAVQRMMVARELGSAADEVVIEERLQGFEFSLLTICSESGLVSLPVAQDYKRAHDGDVGPNTGGMGTYSPVPAVSASLAEEAERRVAAPILAALAQEGVPFRGMLFSGLLVQDGVPFCLEYNVRFGDPETQSVLSRLGVGLAESLWRAARGERPTAPEVVHAAAVTVVVASGGYPGPYPKGLPIEIGPVPVGAKLFHAGTARRDGQLVTNGGRVIGATGVGTTPAEARTRAYQAAEAVRFEGAFFRRDIAS